METTNLRGSRKRRGQRALMAGVAAVLASASLLGTLPGNLESASAAAGDTGSIQFAAGIDSASGWNLRAYNTGRGLAWCVEPMKKAVNGASYRSLGNFGPAKLNDHNRGNGGSTDRTSQHLVSANAAMYDHRNSGDRVTNAALSLYVWNRLDPQGFYNKNAQNGYSGSSDTRAVADWMLNWDSEKAAIFAKYDQLHAKYDSYKVTDFNQNPGKLTMTTPDGGRSGVVGLDLTGIYDGGTATVKLANAAVDKNGNGRYDQGEPTNLTMKDGEKVKVVPIKHGVDVSATGQAASGKKFFEGAIEYLSVGDGNVQDMAMGIAPKTAEGKLSQSSSFPAVITIKPTVKTKVPTETKYVAAGETISDEWTLSSPDGLVPGMDYVMSGTVYGPFPTDENGNAAADPDQLTEEHIFDQIEGVTVTAGKPTAQVTTSKPVETAGAYVFVARFDYAEQNDKTKQIIEKDWKFEDQFGLPEETAVRIADVTTKAQPEAAIGEIATDTLIVNGFIPEGADITTTLYDNNGTPGDTSDDKVIGTAKMAEPIERGTYENAEFISEAVNVGNPYVHEDGTPMTREERIAYDEVHSTYWVDRITLGDKVLHEGKRELPNETTDVPNVDVVTQATEQSATFSDFTDTAKVNGVVPQGATLEFEAFQEVTAGSKKVDKNGKIVRDENGNPVLWTEEEIAELGENNVCEAQPIAHTQAVVVEAGHVTDLLIESTPIRTEGDGKVNWVETLRDKDGNIIHRGECGLDNETTIVPPPHVTTKADPHAPVFGDFQDTAVIDGAIPDGATLGFEAFQEVKAGDQKVDSLGRLRWTDEGNPIVWSQEEVDALIAAGKLCEAQPIANQEPVALETTGVLSSSYQVLSEPIRTEANGKVSWVETLYSQDGEVVHRGECGIPNETTEVTKPKVHTKATPEAVVGDNVKDTAIVDGNVPEGAYVTFELYRIEEGYDVSKNKVAPVTETATPEPTEPTESATPIPADPEETPLPAEPTEPEVPMPTDEAPIDDAPTDPRGNIPACLDAEKVFDTKDQPVAVNAGLNENAEYQSPEWKSDKAGTYYWVGTLHAADGSIIHRDECGAEGETTKISEPPAKGAGGSGLASTGNDFPVMWVGGLAVLMMVLGAGALGAKRRLDLRGNE